MSSQKTTRKKRKYTKRSTIGRCVLRIPVHLNDEWEKLIHISKVSSAKKKIYMYGFSNAANKCGLGSVAEFNSCVSAAQLNCTDQEWLQLIASVGCGQQGSDKDNSAARDVAKGRLLLKWKKLFATQAGIAATAPEIPATKWAVQNHFTTHSQTFQKHLQNIHQGQRGTTPANCETYGYNQVNICKTF